MTTFEKNSFLHSFQFCYTKGAQTIIPKSHKFRAPDNSIHLTHLSHIPQRTAYVVIK